MKGKLFLFVSTVFLLAMPPAGTSLTILLTRPGVSAPPAIQSEQKTLREIAKGRDVVRESKPMPQFSTFDELIGLSHAVVYGRITGSMSYLNESDHPLEDGDYITTEFTVEVNRVLKDTRLNSPLDPGQAKPVPLATPLKIARNGGVIRVNGHRAEVKVKGYEYLKPGRDYVFFLFWSTDYKSYILAGDMSGVIIVADDLSLKPLASSEEILERLRGADLESLATEISRRN